jgi:hypothetical protein
VGTVIDPRSLAVVWPPRLSASRLVLLLLRQVCPWAGRARASPALGGASFLENSAPRLKAKRVMMLLERPAYDDSRQMYDLALHPGPRGRRR